jgi:hypothetical protein
MRGTILIALLAGAAACSTLAGFEDFTGPSGDGESGAASGDEGGTVSGTGGSGEGGTSAGGSEATGGVAGTARGGAPAGGDGNGGADGGTSGGTSTGGSPSGGSSTGGASTGGAATGGSATGGAMNGGNAGSGGSSGGGAGGAAAGSGPTGGAAGCSGQLLVNGNFAAGRGAPWQEEANWPAGPLIVHRNDSGLTSRSVTPHSDDFLAWLGGDPEEAMDHRMDLWQEVTIPAEATSMTIAGFVWVATAETDQTTHWDYAYIDLRTADEERDLVWSFEQWSNRNAGSGWMPITDPLTPTQRELEALRGRTLLFMVHTVTDETGPTHFWFDSLVLDVGCGR